MKRLFIVLAAVAICCPSCLNEDNSMTGGQKDGPAKLVGNPFGEKEGGVVLVKLSDSATTSLSEGGLDTAELLGGLEEASIEPIFSGNTKGSLGRWHKISFNKEISVETAAAILSMRDEITSVQYNSILVPVHSSESVEYTQGAIVKSAVPAATSNLPFNDFYLKDQWDMINDGTVTEGAVAGADVNVKDAWRLTAGDPRIIVAVLDQGIAVKHSDLKNSIWNNTAEVNGVDGVDDDNNGFIDDKYGFNFTDDSAVLTYGYGSDHGTHIAGTIAATNNNGIGVSSIAGGSGNGDGVRVMSCQTFTRSGESTSDWVAKAFKYAADNGACIAQCSYGYQEMDGMSAAQIREWMDSSVEYEALQYFLNPANANCEALETNIAIYSAGNYNEPYSLYPGALKDCISVTAFCPDFLPGGYSNYGAGCDIAAPGGDIVEGKTDAPCMILSTGIGTNGQMTYIYKYGTSMACPHVSGVVALGASYALKIGKKFSREEFISRLLGSARDIDSYQTGSVNKLWVRQYYDANATMPGWKSEYVTTDVIAKKGKMGVGAVDAWNFLMALEGTPSFMTTPDQKLAIDVARHIGTGYTLEIDSADAESLGIAETPQVKNGILEITCTKIGSGKIRFKASVGKDENGVIPELDYYKSISIISRPAVSANGGWL